MSGNEIKSTELAKELGIKATDIVNMLGRIRGAEYKKGTTNVKLSAEEAAKIRTEFKPGKAPAVKEKAATPKITKKEEIKPEKIIEKAPEKPKHIKKEEPARPVTVKHVEAKPVAPKPVEAKPIAPKPVVPKPVLTKPAAPAPTVTEIIEEEPEIPEKIIEALIIPEEEEIALPEKLKKEIEIEAEEGQGKTWYAEGIPGDQKNRTEKMGRSEVRQKRRQGQVQKG